MTVMDLFRLDDKVVIVTGASSGLGVAFAHAFAEAGADVARIVLILALVVGLVEVGGVLRVEGHELDVGAVARRRDGVGRDPFGLGLHVGRECTGNAELCS